MRKLRPPIASAISSFPPQSRPNCSMTASQNTEMLTESHRYVAAGPPSGARNKMAVLRRLAPPTPMRASQETVKMLRWSRK
eukprot:360578-Chlamydomonas_euryale.AAC.1